MHRSLLRTGLLLLTSSWYAACGGERVDVQPGGPGSGAATSGSSADAVTGAGGGGGDGSGGALPAGSGGAGGSTSTGGGPAGAGGSGGDPYASCGVTADCVGDQPTPCPENACESPDLFDACDGDDVPGAYVACVVWADLLRENVWATLVDCLRAASPDELCADASDVADRCWDEVTANTCLNPDAAARCRTAADLCEGDVPLDVEACTADLQPYAPTALDAYASCIADRAGDVACDALHADCLADLNTP